ncbi:MAG: SycD/LcrH family type III secretion system chaperone [Parachlamydiaceae bacterium]
MTTTSFDELTLEKWIEAAPYSTETLSALYAIAYEYYRNGKYAEAKTSFHLLTIADTSDTRFWMGLGASYQMLKNYDAAIHAYSIAAVQNCSDPYVHFYAAECFFYQGNLPKALEAIDSSLTVAKDTQAGSALISKLELLSHTWSLQHNGGNHG